MSLNDLKKLTLEAALATGEKVTIVLNPQWPGAEVPQQHRHTNGLGYNLPRPTTDIDFGAAGLGVTLSFNGQPERCYIPWEALQAVVCSTLHGAWALDPMPTAQAPAPAIEPTRGGLKLVK